MDSISTSSSGSTLHRRPTVLPRRLTGGNPLRPDIDPPPKPPRVLPFLAFCLILFLVCLQFFLPATHFRDPSDRRRNWIPISPNQAEQITKINVGDEKVHVFSWMDCLDLRMLAVLANSTISASRHPENLFFHFYVPEGEDQTLSYYKLKVLLPHSNLEIIGQKEVKELLRSALLEPELLWPSLNDIVPLLIPIFNPSLNRFVYIPPNSILKGSIEDLFVLDMGNYSIAGSKDCTRKLGHVINIEIVNAIQRTAAKTWVSDKLYDHDMCMLGSSVLLVDVPNLHTKFIEALQWWVKILDLKDDRSNKINAAIALTLYNRYHELPSFWKIDAMSMSSDIHNKSKTNILQYDGPARVCSGDMIERQESNSSNVWRQYLGPKSDAVIAS